MKAKISELIECKEFLQDKLAGLQATSKRIENLMSDTPDGSAKDKDIESKLKALELDFDLDSKIK